MFNNYNLEKENNSQEISKNLTSPNISNKISDLNQKLTNLENKIEENANKISTIESNLFNQFLNIRGGLLLGSLNLNNNPITNLSTPEDASPLFASNVGFVMNKVGDLLKKISNLNSINTTLNEEINNIKISLNKYEDKINTLSLTTSTKENQFSIPNNQDLNMQSHKIYGLATPEDKDLDHATNVAFVKAYINPISNRLSSITNQLESNTKSLCNIQLNFLPTIGGSIYGSINMQNNKLTGLKSPSNPSDAVNLEYLNQRLGTPHYSIIPNTSLKNNLLYSIFPNYQVNSQLPLPLLKSGYKGWTWNLSSSYSGGYYNWNNLNFEQTNPESQSFEFSKQNPNELLLKQAGEYVFSFSLVALIPANTNQNYPSIQLNVEEDFSLWGKRNQTFTPSQSKAMTLTVKDRISILGVFYDIVELPSLSPQVNTRILVSPKQKHCSISLQNINFKCNEASSLYIVQNNVSIAWTSF